MKISDDQKNKLRDMVKKLYNFNESIEGRHLFISIHMLESYIDNNYNLCGGGDKDYFSYTGISHELEHICNYLQIKAFKDSSSLIDELNQLHIEIFKQKIKLLTKEVLRNRFREFRIGIINRINKWINNLNRTRDYILTSDNGSRLSLIVSGIITYCILHIFLNRYMLFPDDMKAADVISLLYVSAVIFFGFSLLNNLLGKHYSLAISVVDIIIGILIYIFQRLRWMFGYRDYFKNWRF